MLVYTPRPKTAVLPHQWLPHMGCILLTCIISDAANADISQLSLSNDVEILMMLQYFELQKLRMDDGWVA